jgi:fumarate reductase subunit C
MKYLEQKPGAFWWTRNLNCLIYFTREIAGIMLGAWAFIIVLAINANFMLNMSDHGIFTWPTATLFQYIALIASIIHSITWLHAIPKTIPLNISKKGHIIAYLILLAIWISIFWLTTSAFLSPKSYD